MSPFPNIAARGNIGKLLHGIVPGNNLAVAIDGKTRIGGEIDHIRYDPLGGAKGPSHGTPFHCLFDHRYKFTELVERILTFFQQEVRTIVQSLNRNVFPANTGKQNDGCGITLPSGAFLKIQSRLFPAYHNQE